MFSIPSWVQQYKFDYTKVAEVPDQIFNDINAKLDTLTKGEPDVSIVIGAWNEEINILKNVASLADLKSRYSIEIIVINNNSTDGTQTTLDKLNIRNYFQPIQGWGPARQMGLEQSRGKYILLADADCVYPACWVDDMLESLSQNNVSCVYGRYSFIPEKGYPRWKLYMLERMKDVISELRHLKRPYLNAYGISMGYVKAYGLEIGHIMTRFRGDDGKMAFDLMKYGKVKQVKGDKARAWTAPRTLQRDGSYSKALWNRLKIESAKSLSFLTAMKPHDTKNVPGE
ncbi:glycosyltransferase family 2 protein [Pedobacter frigidisoli]|uniref:glycosyltransferase family 2 protein n=1 Tax=Pedobacter frigidisoli TaxID=2530455 RepID=UPI00292F0569|nr:glycosyltransferase family 2 protein [Pedobacter frigidisoli]